MAIDLSREFENDVQRKAQEEERSTEEYLRHALKDAGVLRALRRSLDLAESQANRGELVDGEEFLQRMDDELAEEERREKGG